jgi:ATP-dependent RNA helicase DDX5/DBP2
MSPTRELAMQIHQQAQVFAKAAGLRSVAVYGGAPKGPQIRDIRMGAHIIIATPGRLNDLLVFQCQDGSAVLSLDEAQTLVLDEADRMCDMGFEEDIKKIVDMMPETKQTLFFTATW